MLADARLLALRELMKMEMPDRWSDVINQNMQASAPLNNLPNLLTTVPALTQAYRRQLFAAQDSGASLDEILDNQRAECLYLTIMYATGDGEARTHFTQQDIGDTDGDGAPEFLDGWGNPIEWVRWPAGFVAQSALMTGDFDGDHDSFDVFHRDSISTINSPPTNDYPTTNTASALFTQAVQIMRARNQQAQSQNMPQLTAFRLVPLVFSAGADEITAIESPDGPADWIPIDPYYMDGDGVQFGATDEDTDFWVDNIHNHLTEF